MSEERVERRDVGSNRAEGVSVVGVPARGAQEGSGRRARGASRSRSAVRDRRAEADKTEEAQGAAGVPEDETEEEFTEESAEDDRGRTMKQSGSRRAPGRRAGVLPLRAEVAAIVLAVVGVVAGIGFGFAWANLNSQNSERQSVASAARTFVLDVTNFKPTTVDADFAQVQNWAASGSLFDKQAAQFYNSNIRQSLVAVQAVSQGQIRNLYVETLGGSKAEVYAVVDQAYQNSKMSSPATDTLRMTLDMVTSPHGWRISAVTVENPSSGSANSSGSSTPSG